MIDIFLNTTMLVNKWTRTNAAVDIVLHIVSCAILVPYSILFNVHSSATGSLHTAFRHSDVNIVLLQLQVSLEKVSPDWRRY